MTTIQPDNLSQGVSLSMATFAQVKVNISRAHLAAAQMFASECEQIAVQQGAMVWPQKDWDSSRYRANAAVMLAAAALEASINEFYLEANDGNSNSLGQLSKAQINALSADWSTKVEPPKGKGRLMGILEKYNHALDVCGVALYTRKNGIYDSAVSLVALRNALVHFKPEWDNGLTRHADLEKDLKPRFPSCKLTDQLSMVWFPNKCLGAGCAQWAVDTVRALSADFCLKLQIPDRF